MIRLVRHEAHHGRVVPCFTTRPASVAHMLAQTVSRWPDREAVVDAHVRLTYRELDERSAAVAAGLATRGIRPGDRVALLIANRWEFIVALFAVIRLGAIAVPLNVREQRPELAFVLGHCGARGLVCESALVDRISDPDTLPALAVRITVGGRIEGAAAFEDLCASEPASPVDPSGEDATAVLLYTSGTTGRPKGAMLTHLNIVHSVMHYELAMSLESADRSMLAVPASHVTGLVAIILAMVRVGGCTLVLREFRPAAFLELATREAMTHTLVVPAIYNLLLRDPALAGADLARWRIGGFGGAPMPEGTLHALAARLPSLTLQNCYGATETTSPATIMPIGLQAAHPDSVGTPLVCCDIKVMDDDGRELPSGEAGEIWIGGPHVVPGYWANPEATAREFTGGYWKSGDVGSIDREGFVRVLDRRKDLVNRGGYKVYCVEVEGVLSTLPEVMEAAVVAMPDPVLGEKTHAFVVTHGPGLSADTVRAHCAEHLADYKVPDFVTLRSEPLPRNANGKILKRALKTGPGTTPGSA